VMITWMVTRSCCGLGSALSPCPGVFQGGGATTQHKQRERERERVGGRGPFRTNPYKVQCTIPQAGERRQGGASFPSSLQFLPVSASDLGMGACRNEACPQSKGRRAATTSKRTRFVPYQERRGDAASGQTCFC
jgi:hypothetical protein